MSTKLERELEKKDRNGITPNYIIEGLRVDIIDAKNNWDIDWVFEIFQDYELLSPKGQKIYHLFWEKYIKEKKVKKIKN